MAHLIDDSLGFDAIAYVGEAPWHGLGQRLTAGASIEEWTREAGLEYEVLSSPVEYESIESLDGFSYTKRRVMAGRNVLYRSDTRAALSVVSDQYKPVQPREVMDYFRELTSIAGFTMETAGVIDGGKRVWALAKVNEGAKVIGHDRVRPYALLATGYDGTLATTSKLSYVRVVCHNTLSASVGHFDPQTGVRSGGESDTVGAVSTIVRVPHREVFDPKAVRMQLGIYADAFERFMIESRILAEREITLATAQAMTAKVLTPSTTKGVDVRTTKAYQRVLDLFDGAAIGSDMAGPTLWGWINAVTEHVDHERGRDRSRLGSAWFGTGNAIKSAAYDMAVLAS